MPDGPPPIGCDVTEQIPPDAGPDYYQRGGMVWAVIRDEPDDEPGLDVAWRVLVVRPYRGTAQFDELHEPGGTYPSMHAWPADRGMYAIDRGSLRAVVALLCATVAKSRGRSAVAAFNGEARQCVRALGALVPVLMSHDGF